MLLGALVGGGVVVAVAGLRPAPPRSRPHLRLPARPVAAVVGGAAAALLTSWPVLGVAVAAGVWQARRPGAGRRRREAELARGEAVATLTETLRDLVGAARGMEGAIAAAAPLAPPAIAAQVESLAARLRHEAPAPALADFAAAVDDHTAQLVAIVLGQGAEGQVGDVGHLLGELAGVARDEVAHRRRVEAERARTRTTVRVVVATTVVTAGALVALNPRYFDAFAGSGGQLVLAGIVAAAAGALAWLARLARYPAPEPVLVAHAHSINAGPPPSPPAAAVDLARALRVDRLVAVAAPDLRVAGLGPDDLLARQGIGLLVGLVAGPALWAGAAVVGWALPLWLVAWVSAMGAVVGAVAPVAHLGRLAQARRRDFRYALVAFLDLVGLFLAAGRGIEGALDAASRAGAGWAFGELAQALHGSERHGESPWQGLDQLGQELGVPELREAAAAALLGATEGARVRQSLAAKAAALRARALTEAQEQAAAASERMAVPACLLLVSFVALVTYPPVVAVVAGI